MKRFIPAIIAASVVILLLLIRLVSPPTKVIEGSTGDESGAPDANREQVFVSVGTGGVTGVYYQVGGALMKIMNAGQGRHGIKLTFQATGGSVYNINTVLAGDLDIGVAQADRQYQAYQGEGEWAERGPQADLRAICSLHPEAVTLVAADASGIRTPADLKGKRVNIGNPGSGNRGNALLVLQLTGLDPDADLHTEGVKAAESAKLLQDGRIDAFFYTVGHPAGSITEATSGRRPVRIIPITGIDDLVRERPYYGQTRIRMKHYPKAANDADVPSLGMLTTVVASASASEEMIYTVTRELFENLDAFRALHPAFENLAPEQMVGEGLTAPLHPGAARYYREAGLLPGTR